MPNHSLTTRPAVAKIKHAPGTTMYSDPTIKSDPDARGVRLAVGATTKTWVLSKRIEGKVRTIMLGAWPDLPTVFAARDVAKEKMQAVDTKTDAQSTAIFTLRDAMESHIAAKTPSARTVSYYREQIDRHLSDLFDRPIDQLMLPDLERALAKHLRDGKPTATLQHLQHLVRIAFKRATDVRGIRNLALALGKVKYTPTTNRVKFDTSSRWPALDLIEAKKQQNLIIGTAYEVMLFTGLRAGSVSELRWEHIDLERAQLRVERLKNGLMVTFPLSDRVTAALRALPRNSEWVFPQADTSKHIYNPPDPLSVGSNVLRPHDCRRLFTTAARKLRLPSYIIDQLRGDTIKSTQDLYDQGSMTHHDANAIARQIEVECGLLPDSNLVHLAAVR